MDGLSDLERFVHSDIHLPTLVKIGFIHAQLETIHPFLDGNGRIGRLLITFLLCQSEVLIRPVLYISHYFKRHRSEYYDRLQRVRDMGDWEGWIKFFLSGIATVSLEATETARSIVALREQHREIVQKGFGRAAGNGLTVLESLFQRPFVTVGQVQQHLNITYPPANALVQRFVEAGICTRSPVKSDIEFIIIDRTSIYFRKIEATISRGTLRPEKLAHPRPRTQHWTQTA
jgi:Fic family protein